MNGRDSLLGSRRSVGTLCLYDAMLAVSWQQATARRMARQGLVDGAEAAATPAEAVTRLVAAQAQVATAAELSVALRLRSGTVTDVREAVADGSLVRATGLRQTIHLVPATELGMWVGVFATLPIARFPAAAEEQPTPGEVDLLCEAIAATVAENGPLTLEELHAGVVEHVGPWAADPVMPAFQGMWPRWRLVQGVAARRGLWVYGPNRGRAVTYTAPPPFEPVEPVAAAEQLLLRYLHAYGPSTPAAYAKWHSATVGWATSTFTALTAAGRLTEVDLDGEPAWVVSDDLDFPEKPAHGIRLLPYFDALAIAAHPRERFFPGRVYERALAGGQAGNYPVLVVDGEVAGVWHQRKAARKARISVEPLDPLTPEQQGALEEAADRVARLQGLVAELAVGEVTVGPHA